jgi:hypothetical protein
LNGYRPDLHNAVDHNRLNLIANFRKAVDREAAATLLLLLFATVAAVILLPGVMAGDAAGIRDGVLKGAGGVLLLLGSYYGARTLKENRTDKRTDQILKAFELLATHNDGAVRAGAISVLEALDDASSGAQETWQREAIKRALANIQDGPAA